MSWRLSGTMNASAVVKLDQAIDQRSSIQLLSVTDRCKVGFMFCSDSPACCQLTQKTVQERRKDGGQDQSQDPNGFGVYLGRGGNDYEAGKSDNSRHSTHSDRNKYADNICCMLSPYILRPSKRPERLPLILLHSNVDLSIRFSRP